MLSRVSSQVSLRKLSPLLGAGQGRTYQLTVGQVVPIWTDYWWTCRHVCRMDSGLFLQYATPIRHSREKSPLEIDEKLILFSPAMFVALSMAEIVSSIPSSGGPYFWAYVLAPRSHAAFLSWTTGFFNLAGQIAVTCGISFGLANLIATTALVKNPDFAATPGNIIAIYLAILISQGLINTFGVHLLRYLNNTSIILHSLGVFSLIVAVLAKAPTHQSASFVFTTFNDATGAGDVGWSVRASPAYVAVTGILMAQYTITVSRDSKSKILCDI